MNTMQVPLNEGRGVNPGDRSASPTGRSLTCTTCALNEGRGVNPGDSGDLVLDLSAGRKLATGRSTKAGA